MAPAGCWRDRFAGVLDEADAGTMRQGKTQQLCALENLRATYSCSGNGSILCNKYVSIFISMCITNQRAKYGYGYKMGTGRLKRQKILLPIDANNQPNWNYMETYMQNLEQRQILEYLRHIEKYHTY